MVNFTATFAIASLVSLGNVYGKDHPTVPFKVRVRNLTYLQPFSPPLIVAHTKDVALFKEGFPANDAIKLMAEDGDNSALLELAASEDVAPYICGAVVAEGPPVFPGQTWRGQLDVDRDICPDPVYSVVSMLINTNDAFVGIDSDTLKGGSTKAFPPAFDAGTEDNNELCSSIPGPGCPAGSGNIQNGPGEGHIHLHRGFHGVGDLEEASYDWRNPVAEIFIQKL